MYFDAHATGKRIKKSSVVFKDTATSTSRSIEAAHSPLSILPKWRSLMFSFMANCSCVSPWALRAFWKNREGRMCRFDRPAGRSGSIFENHTGLFDLRRDRNSTGKGAERID